MSRQLPPEGDYTAKCNGQLKVIEAKTGTLGVAVPYKLNEHDFSDVHVVYIAKADGQLMENNIKNLKQVFGWDGIDPWALCYEDPDTQQKPRSFDGLEFRLSDCKHESFVPEGKTDEITTFKPSWLNPIDGGRNFELADRSKFLKSFGSKFRAAAGTTSKPSKPPVLPTKKAGPPAKSSSPAPSPCSQEEAWGALVKKHPGKPEQEHADIWWSTIERVLGLKDSAAENLTPEQHGKLRAEFA